VSAYANLPSEDAKNGDKEFNLRQLSSASLGAFRIFQWLSGRRAHNLPVPLATCWVLLSPSESEIATEPALPTDRRPTIEAFRSAAIAWREAAQSHARNMTFFYFAGHGFQRTRNQHVMLMEGFAEQNRPALWHAIDTQELINGMAPTRANPTIARTQLYFIDACRTVSKVFYEKYDATPAYHLWDPPSLGDVADERLAPTYYTTVPGETAYGIKGKQTAFSKALLACLSGGAAVEDPQYVGENGPRYQVTVNSLNNALGHFMDQINHEEGTNQSFRTHGIGGFDPILHYPDGRPEVDLTLNLVPGNARKCARIIIHDDRGNEICNLKPRDYAHPYRRRLPAGYYHVTANIEPPTNGYFNCGPQIRQVIPPVGDWSLRVGPQ
jgi:Caspase domain